jgi:hypothetical protein
LSARLRSSDAQEIGEVMMTSAISTDTSHPGTLSHTPPAYRSAIQATSPTIRSTQRIANNSFPAQCTHLVGG